jgi:TP901-1 family phage major tail protein
MPNYTRGMDMLLYANTAPEGSPETYVAIAGQRGATLNRSAETIETTNKTTGEGYKEFATSFKEWSIDTDGMLIFDDSSYNALETAYLNNSPLTVQLKSTDGETFSGTCIITDFPIEFPYDDMATYSISLTGSGPLERTSPVV